MHKGAIVLVLILTSCGSSEPTEVPASGVSVARSDAEEGEPWGARRPTQLGRYQVAVAFEPEHPPMGELFIARATVWDKQGALVEDAKVALDALMPHHGHGMETDPIDRPGVCGEDGRCVHAGGVYTTEGFKFHMPGEWTVTVQIDGAGGQDSTSFVFPLTVQRAGP